MVESVVGEVAATWESGWIGKAQIIGIGWLMASVSLVATIGMVRMIDERFAKKRKCKGVIKCKHTMVSVPNDENYVIVEDTPEVRRHPFVRYVFQIDCSEDEQGGPVFDLVVEPELYDHLNEGTIVPVVQAIGLISKTSWLAEAPKTVWQWEQAIDEDLCDEPNAGHPDRA